MIVCVFFAPIFDFGGQIFPFSIILDSLSCQLYPKCPINWQISFTTRTHNEAENDHWNYGNRIFIDQSTEQNS